MKLPESELYEKSLRYWPYKKALRIVTEYIVNRAPEHGSLLDIMCGPGYLLGEIVKKRKDLQLTGVDIDKRYVTHGRETYPDTSFIKGDVLRWRPKSRFDIVVCTGALHHISYGNQELAVSNISTMVKPGGFAIISDCYIDDYSDEIERKLAAEKLGHEYLIATIRNNAPNKVIAWTVGILSNDVLKKEFKTSLAKRLPVIKKHFGSVKTFKTWPEAESEYGDYIHICYPT